MKNIITIILLSIFISCNHKPKGLKDVKVHTYKQHSTVVDNDPTNDWIFWYIIFGNNNSCYYYSSPSYATNYSGASWISSPSVPLSINNNNPNSPDVEELTEQNIQINELPQEIQTEIDQSPDNFEGSTNEDVGADDGVSDGDSDTGSGDSGGGDSGGGE